MDFEGSRCEKVDNFFTTVVDKLCPGFNYGRIVIGFSDCLARTGQLLMCLRWLGHLGNMGCEHLPKQLLFGELLKKRPFHMVL